MFDKLNENAPFQLKGQSKEFAAKQKDLFNQLDVLENTTKRTLTLTPKLVNHEETYVVPRKRGNFETKSLRGKESIFKRPEAPITKCLRPGRLPDFRKNPQNWTKYSLNEVEDVTDKSNTAAALSFFKELEARKHREPNLTNESESKIVFNKTVLIKDLNNDEDNDCNKITFKSSKVVMPEYVIGQKIKKDKKNREKRNCNVTKQLRLDHLMRQEEEEEDMDC